MAVMYGQGATYDAIESRFRRFRKMADDLRAEAQSRGINVSSSTPRTPRVGARARPVNTPSSTASKGKNGSSKKGDDDGLPDTPTKSNSTRKPKIDVSDVIALDDSDSEMAMNNKKETSPVAPVKMESIHSSTPTATRFRIARSSSPHSPTPTFHQVKRENLAVGSVTPVKRTIELQESTGLPASRVKTEESAVESAVGMARRLRTPTTMELDEDEDEDFA